MSSRGRRGDIDSVASASGGAGAAEVAVVPAGLEGRSLPRRVLGDRGIQTVVSVYVFLVVLMVLGRFVQPSLGSIDSLKTMVGLSTFAAVAAFGQGLVILSGGFDLSIPSTITISGVVFTTFTMGSNGRALPGILLVLALGAGIGIVNGLGITLFNLSPVVMTLAVNVILDGVILVYTQGTPKGTAPPWIVHLVQGRIFGDRLPEIIVVLLVFVAIGVVLLSTTTFARRVYAVGSNRQVAFLSGVRVNRIVVVVYAISGVCAAFDGVLLSGQTGQSYLNMGDPYLLLSLAAVVLGGAAILGGRGYYLGTVGGALILTTASVILAGTTLPEAVRQIFYSLAIITAVVAARQR